MANDRNTVNRTDDVVASYSNFGPRLDDGDDDEWDELKPDLTSYGRHHRAGHRPDVSRTTRAPLADNENIDSKDGNARMVTPLVSGIVATLLGADDTLSPEDIRNILRILRVPRVSLRTRRFQPMERQVGFFGLKDASCALDHVLRRSCTRWRTTAASSSPLQVWGRARRGCLDECSPNQSLHLAGNTLSVEGTTDTSENDYIEVQVKFEQFYDDGDSTELTNWLGADGTVEDWYFDIVVDDDWVDADEAYTLVYARALNEDGEASVVDVCMP